jgi:hypothetical protein
MKKNSEGFEEIQGLEAEINPSVLLRDSPEYQNFANWMNNFCDLWNAVIDQIMKVNQTTMSKDEYIAYLENQYKVLFPKCNYRFDLKDPEPLNVIKNLPTAESNAFNTNTKDPMSMMNSINRKLKPPTADEKYKNALDFMATQIGKMKQQTQDALSGKPVSTESFDNQCCSSCSCTAEPQNITNARRDAATTIIQRLKEINPLLNNLNGQIAIVKSGLQDLQAIKNKAESGELVKEVNIPA